MSFVQEALVQNIIIGDFNVNCIDNTEKQPLYNVMIKDNHCRQSASSFSTDNKTRINNIFTNITDLEINSDVLETYFTDRKAIWVSGKTWIGLYHSVNETLIDRFKLLKIKIEAIKIYVCLSAIIYMYNVSTKIYTKYLTSLSKKHCLATCM